MLSVGDCPGVDGGQRCGRLDRLERERRRRRDRLGRLRLGDRRQRGGRFGGERHALALEHHWRCLHDDWDRLSDRSRSAQDDGDRWLDTLRLYGDRDLGLDP
ncbi:MAG: hypothetical protein DMD96_15945 [Candidatus Rokuibacteriota bacterium]|nr:MAG: hypothetical protein DMD96_15945 [Candidatus Rokubacteria bacterium]